MTESAPTHIPDTPPQLLKKHPRDEYTWGTIAWAIILGISGVVEVYGLWYDKTHPGNRQKWTLSSNATTWGGFDSYTNEAIDVPFGKLRRTALLLSVYWVLNHWTSKRGTY